MVTFAAEFLIMEDAGLTFKTLPFATFKKHSHIKAALVNISILTMNQMNVCNVRSVVHIDKRTENHHPTLLYSTF